MTKAAHRGSEHSVQLPHVQGRTVGQGAVGLGPHVFRRIEFRGVGRERFHLEPRMGGDPLGDFPAAMDRTPVPQQDHRSPKVPEQVAQEGSDIQPCEIADPKRERGRAVSAWATRPALGWPRADPVSRESPGWACALLRPTCGLRWG